MGMGNFLVMLISFTGAAATLIGVTAWAIRHIRRNPPGSGPGQLTSEDMDALRDRLAELEQREGRVIEIEERVDFLERMVGRSREPERLPRPGVPDPRSDVS